MGAKAWLVTWAKDTDTLAIVCATTRGQASAAYWRSARDASIDVDWCAIKAVRAPEYDLLSTRKNYCMRPLLLQYARLYLTQLLNAANNVT
jgi:hypothetical protein